MTISLDLPYLPYDTIRQKATSFLSEHHPSGDLPVPIEEIAEFHFGINIVPLPGLLRDLEVDGFTSADLTTISVDQDTLEQDPPRRYRFTLAHETGHVVLHKSVFQRFTFSTIEEYKRQVRQIDETDHRRLEFQGYAFAGLVLVPGKQLEAQLMKAIDLAASQGFSIADYPDVAQDYVEQWLANVFLVSTDVIQRRLQLDKLWPPPENMCK